MKYLILGVCVLFIFYTKVAAAVVCPTQQVGTIDARNGRLMLCSDQPTTEVQFQRNNIAQKKIPFVLTPGVSKMMVLTTCGLTPTMKIRGINNGLVSPWGEPVKIMLPKCAWIP